MTDETGTSYLDTRNNVAHVGHQNPAVVAAVQRQVAVLNTNTRYLHPNMTLLAQRLADRLPDPLEVVFFCNSGSEANDLALRLARVFAGGSLNTIVVDGAYHGHTLACLEVSPYKYTPKPNKIAEMPLQPGPRGHAVPGPHIFPVPAPDLYRGEHTFGKTAAAEYAQYVQAACAHFVNFTEQRIRAMIIEGGMSVAGVILPPAGYLKACQKAVHAAGGLLICDEVQTGLGRLGHDCEWAFQANDDDDDPLVPDIVTLGKACGNGMPLAAVITTRTVASALEETGVEYFNTFAGNPVSAAAGLAVLDELERGDLARNATLVGRYLKNRLLSLQKMLPELIGDVRGQGLFLGVEFVKNRETKEPATAETSFLCIVLLKKYQILTSIDGPRDNVLVIKPPMVFSRANADTLVDALTEAATVDLPAAVTSGELAQLGRTPT